MNVMNAFHHAVQKTEPLRAAQVINRARQHVFGAFLLTKNADSLAEPSRDNEFLFVHEHRDRRAERIDRLAAQRVFVFIHLDRGGGSKTAMTSS